jgi:ERCC4-type nuclease
MPSRCTLVIDARERNVTRHAVEFANITYRVKQITIGDYAIIDPAGSIMAVIERKSLEDAAASLKDGRWANRDKMLTLRQQTGCRIIYIIEGLKPRDYDYPNTLCGRTPYKHIESSIFHMMMRDNISTLWTMDTIDTARTLARFVHSMDTLLEDMDSNPEANISNIIEGGEEGQNTQSADDLLTQVIKSDTKDIVREMWSCFKGIAITTADEFMKSYTVSDIVCKKVARGDIEKIKTAGGRKISKKVIDSLSNVEKSVEIRLLSKVPGISTITATEIVNQTPLSRLLSYSVGAISIIKVGKSKRNLGELRAGQIKAMFDFKYGVEAQVQPIIPAGQPIVPIPPVVLINQPAPEPVLEIAIDDAEINDLLNSI